MNPKQAADSITPLLAQGEVGHVRFRPFQFGFSYPMHFLASWHKDDQSFPNAVPGPLGLRHRWRRRDYLPQHGGSLRQAAFVEALGRTPTNNESVLHLGTWRQGPFIFNPVCFYILFDGEKQLGVLSEITNIPWRQRQSYWIPAGAGETHSRHFAKEFHI